MILARALSTLAVAAVAAAGGVAAAHSGVLPDFATAPTATVSAPPQPAACSEPLPPAPGSGATASGPVNVPEGGGTVNLNTATMDQLIALPGVGKIEAARIIAARPFKSVGELSKVARLP